MKQYFLKTKKGEVVNNTKQICLGDAIEYFSLIKKITQKKLLEIFNVEENEDWNND